jgi:hypothetical protein
LLTGCAGYHVGPLLKGNYKTVAVPMFKNHTYHPQVEAQVTNALIKRLQSDGALQVASIDNADVLVTGEVTRYLRGALRSVRQETREPREYKLTIEVRISVRDQRTGQLLLKPTLVTGSAETFIGSDLQSAEYQALPLIADDVARRASRLLTESW